MASKNNVLKCLFYKIQKENKNKWERLPIIRLIYKLPLYNEEGKYI